jgi:uncharacterized protein YgiM (DUF1202 family)
MDRAETQKVRKQHQNLEESLARQTAAQERLKENVAKLQLRLLEKETQVKELQKKLDEAIQEVVRAKAKLHTLESKAEAASVMAEAEVALKALRARTAEQGEGSEVTQAEQLLKMSVQEFKTQNYGGALYLTAQAKSFIKMGEARVRSREQIPVREGEALFALPLPLQVLRPSNVREGPGLGFKILFTLDRGTPLVGYSYKDRWVRVKDRDGRGGWIFHALVDRTDGRSGQ